jgi:hypothetical protein
VVRSAIAYWVHELGTQGRLDQLTSESDSTWIGTQYLHEKPCSAATDLRFQLGTLTTEQRANLPERDAFAAITIRTDYDAKSLRGRGFIYVAPESGELRPSASTFPPHPWSEEHQRRLRLTLMHELGHVYGIGHFGARGLMAENFMDQLFSSTGDLFLGDPSVDPQVLRVTRFLGETRCEPADVPDWGRERLALGHRYFGTPANMQCNRIELTPAGLKLWVKPNASSTEWQLGGQTEGEHLGSCAGGGPDQSFPMQVFLPADQTVYTKDPPYKVRDAWPDRAIDTCVATYVSADGKARRLIVIRRDLDRPLLSGVLDGKFILNLQFPSFSDDPTPAPSPAPAARP